MNVTVDREKFDNVAASLDNTLITTEEWTPEKGILALECDDDLIVADVMECEYVGHGRWLLVFVPIGPGVAPKLDHPITKALEEIPEIPKIPEETKRANRDFLRRMTKPWNGYYEK